MEDQLAYRTPAQKNTGLIYRPPDAAAFLCITADEIQKVIRRLYTYFLINCIGIGAKTDTFGTMMPVDTFENISLQHYNQ